MKLKINDSVSILGDTTNSKATLKWLGKYMAVININGHNVHVKVENLIKVK